MKSPNKNGIGEVVTEYGARVMKVIKKGLLGRSLFDFYGDIKAQTFKTKEMASVPSTPADGKGGVIYTKSADGKLYYKSNEVAEVELSADDNATTVVVTDDESSNVDHAITFVNDLDGSTSVGLESDGDFYYNPSTGTVTASNLNSSIGIAVGNDVAITATNASLHGLMTLLEDANSSSGPIFTLKKTRGGSIAAQDNDEVGEIRFQSIDDKSPTPDTIVYSRLITSILDASDGNECGKLDLYVANDGSSKVGMSITGNVSTADQVDVTIGNLPTSETTINGNVTIQNTSNDDVAPTLKIYNNRTNDGVDDQSTGIILFAGKDDGTPSEKTFGKIECVATDTQAGAEDSKILLYSMVSGVLVNRLTLAEFGAESDLTSDLKVVGYVKSSVGPSTTPRFWLNYQDGGVAADEIIGDVTWSNEDDDGHTLRIQGVATEDHASGSAGGSKLEFYTTPNTTSALALAATIGQDKSLTVEGDLQVKGNDIKDDDGTTCITFDSSGNTTIAGTTSGTFSGNLTGNASGTAATVTGGTQAAITTCANLTTVGTIDTGTWQGTAIASAYLDADTAHLSGSQTFIGDKTFNRKVILDGDKSVTAGSDGVTLHVDAQDITDTSTSGSGTATTFNHVVFENPRLMATNSSVTTTNASTVYIKGAPVASTNQTITNSYSLYVAAGLSYFNSNVTIGGDLDITGNILPGITYVKILPSDFVPDDAGRPAMIDDTGSDRWLESHGTAKLFAYVDIPVGFKATHVDVYGSATSAVTVYEADVNSKTVTSKGTGNIGTQINITDVNSDATNYILIELAQASGEEVYGGKLTIAKI